MKLTDGEDHENGRHEKCQRITGGVAEARDIAAKHRCEEARDQGAKVDGKVKEREECGQVSFLLR